MVSPDAVSIMGISMYNKKVKKEKVGKGAIFFVGPDSSVSPVGI
jgi:hypothetical protein